jgi:hypothetical protein
MARIPVSGVRTSCANAASAASITPDPAGFTARFATRLRALPAAAPGARFFGGRLFGDRVVRWERGFDAMIPPTLAAPTMPWPGSVSHAEGGFSPCDRPGAKAGRHQDRPTRRRMSAGVAPAARSSRKPVALVDFESFRPAPSRMRRWCR